jgi:hypothetical protein
MVISTSPVVQPSVFNYYLDTERQPAYHLIIPDENRRAMASFLEKIPASMSELWGYEVRLRDIHLKTDFQICSSRTSVYSLLQFLSSNQFEHKIWSRFLDLTTRWNNTDDPVSQLIYNIWFEMDAVEMAADQPVPNFFFAPMEGLNPRRLSTLTRYILSILGFDLSDEAVQALGNINAALPGKAWVPQIGMMAARNSETVRIFIHEIGEEEIITYLRNLDFSFNFSELKLLLHGLHKVFDFINIDIDTGPRACRSAVGIECYFTDLNEARLKEALRFFSDVSTIDPEYTTRILAYFNYCLSQPPLLYKEFIHHFKLNYCAGRAPEAKLYLGVRRRSLWFKA